MLIMKQLKMNFKLMLSNLKDQNDENDFEELPSS